MKRYLRLSCTNCLRSIDKLVDITHYAPDQCTITLGCEGRLLPVGYLSSGNIAVAPEIGVTDWRPRGASVTTTTSIAPPTLVDLATGTLNQVVIAVPGVPSEQVTYELTFSVKNDTPKTYRQYIFRQEGAFSTISGVESGLEKKALRFTAFGSDPDVIDVYVNGVKRNEGTDPEDYQLYDGTGTSVAPPNTISFNTPIEQAGVVQVDVVVSKEQTSATINLTFKRNKQDESRTALGAYENIDYVDRLVGTGWRRYYLFTLDLADANIPLNSILLPVEPDEEALFLLARKPYTQLDRYTTVVLPLANMSEDRDYVKYHANGGSVPIAQVTDTAAVSIFPPLRLGKFAVERTIKTVTPGVEEQLVVDGKVITGPDA